MVAAVFAQLAGKRELTPWERQDCEDVIEAAQEWAAGRLPLEEFAKVGMCEYRGVPSAGYTRYLALGIVGPGSEAGKVLLRAVDALLHADRNLVVTTSGIFTFDDVTRNGIVVR